MKKALLLTSTIIITGLTACKASEPAETPTNDISAQAHIILDQAFPESGPGAVAIITKDNQTVFIGAQGVANLETSEELKTDSVFRYASISKQFAAATLMLLVEDGLVDLDDPISTYLPDYPEPGASIAVRRLLNHTSGIQSYTSLPGWMIEDNTAKTYTTAELVAVFKDEPVTFEPGEQFSYNNSGYVLIGAIIEAVTNEPWEQVVRDRIGTPLGLDTIDSGIRENQVSIMATGYTGRDIVKPGQAIDMTVPHAAGAIIGNVQDLADWANAFHDGDVVSSESYKAMTSPTILNDGEEIDYGYAFELLELRGEPTIGHSGGIFGFSTDSIYVPKHDLFVAVLTNSDSPTTRPSVLMNRLGAMAMGDPYPEFEKQDVDLSKFQESFGVYKSKNVTRTFFTRNDKLHTFRENGSESEAFYVGDNRFFYGKDSFSWFKIEKGEDGIYQMLFHANDAAEPDILTWTGPVEEFIDVPTEVLESYLGVYKLTIPADATIAPAEDGIENGITIQLTGQPPFDLTPESDTQFAVRSVGATIRFTESDDGAISLEIAQGGQIISGEMAED